MAFRKHKRIWGALIALLVLVPLVAFALVEPKHLSPEARLRTLSIPMYHAIAAGDVTAGTNGVIGITSINGVAAPSITTPSAMQFPSRLSIILLDTVGVNDTLTCASVTVAGRNQFGVSIRETVNTISETRALTSNVFSVVTSITGATCAGASDANDRLRVSVSEFLGSPLRLRAVGDVVSACIVDSSDGTAALEAADPVICYTGAQLNTAGAINLQYHWIDMTDAQLATPAADFDPITITVRPNLPMP